MFEIIGFLDVPNKPDLIGAGVECHAKDATIKWESKGDNRAAISHFIIEYNTSFTPDVWNDQYNDVPATDLEYNVRRFVFSFSYLRFQMFLGGIESLGQLYVPCNRC